MKITTEHIKVGNNTQFSREFDFVRNNEINFDNLVYRLMGKHGYLQGNYSTTFFLKYLASI